MTIARIIISLITSVHTWGIITFQSCLRFWPSTGLVMRRWYWYFTSSGRAEVLHTIYKQFMQKIIEIRVFRSLVHEINIILQIVHVFFCLWLFQEKQNNHNNDIAESSDILKFYLFADDTAIFLSHKDPKTLETIMNQELIKVSSWLIANKLSLNVKKSNALLFRTKNENSAPILNS